MEKVIDFVTVGSIETNCWLYAPIDDNLPLPGMPGGKRPCVVIDPGDEAGLIISRLEELQWFPAFILMTHGHFDHVTALPDLYKAFCGKGDVSPQIGIHRLDAHYLEKNTLARQLEEGDTAGPFKVLHVPGHTPGCVAFYDEKHSILFSGDTLFEGTWGRTDLEGGSDEQIYQSLRRLLSMKQDTVVCPGHGPATSIKDEQRLLPHLG